MSGFNSKQGHVWCLIAPPTIQGLLLPGSDCFSTLQGFDDNNNTLLCRRNLCLDFLSNLSFGVLPPAQLAISLIAHQMASVCLLVVSGIPGWEKSVILQTGPLQTPLQMGTLGSALQRAHGAGGWVEQRQSPEGILVPDWRWAEAAQDPRVQGCRGTGARRGEEPVSLEQLIHVATHFGEKTVKIDTCLAW